MKGKSKVDSIIISPDATDHGATGGSSSHIHSLQVQSVEDESTNSTSDTPAVSTVASPTKVAPEQGIKPSSAPEQGIKPSSAPEQGIKPSSAPQRGIKANSSAGDLLAASSQANRDRICSTFITQTHSGSTSSLNRVGASRTLSASSGSAMDDNSSKNDSSSEVSKPRFMTFLKRKIQSRRGKKETTVKEISITPERDGQWAVKNVTPPGSGSNSRAGSGNASFNGARESPNLVVVHDMDNEYNPEYR
ncbi:uncharacterized protein LOC131936795 isoform X2 [Physella acuta]|uniref:uncharacterized protein LOC131936795 isoform X2 n=1 Tax=Physella acuta TaxID=109671 RepID=UPI0027DB6D9D|nr:uncharacterized protein LOC131936795 isoform X2 [Physella acuta]